jgi:exodeoxyribonuclease V alpha subunit
MKNGDYMTTRPPEAGTEAEDEISVEVAFQRNLYVSEDQRFRVVLVKVLSPTVFCKSVCKNVNHGSHLKAAGKMVPLREGEVVTLRGVFSVDARGECLQVTETLHNDPVTSEGVAAVLVGLVPRLGPATARELVYALGGPEATLAALSAVDAEERVIQVRESFTGLAKKFLTESASKLVDAWKLHRTEREQEIQLAGLGLSPTLRAKIREKYAGDGYRLVREDPYRLMYDLEGVGFRTANEIAAKIGIAREDPRRAEAAIRYKLYEAAYQEGHTCVRMESVLAWVTEQVDSREVAQQGLDRAVDGQKVQHLGEYLALTKFVHLEEFLAERAKDWMYSAQEPQEAVSQCELSTFIDRAIEEHEHSTGHALDPVQREAVALVAHHRVCLVTGGPGTGKSETSNAFVRLLTDLGGEIALCAPTGRAAKRLAESTGRPASTIHRLLGYGLSEDPKSKFLFNQHHKLPVTSVLVDESSMVDSEIMAALLRATSPDTRFVFVGDADQLPPVGPGAPFRDFLASNLPTVRLAKVFRQAQNSRIVESAHRILCGKAPVMSPLGDRSSGAVFFIEQDDPDEAARILSLSVAKSIPTAFGISAREIQVLVPMHKGPMGTLALNQSLQTLINPPSESVSVNSGERVFRVGDRVRQTKNDYTRGIVNGDLGYVEYVFTMGPAPDEYDFARVTARSQGKALPIIAVRIDGPEQKLFFCTKGELSQIQLAYASTVHSAQGGEYPAVVVGLAREHWVMLTRTLLYTALTRAKQLCILVGDKQALKRACEFATAEARCTLLSLLLDRLNA